MNNNPVVLLAGIPASGKSTFGRWLQEKHGFLWLDMENGALEGGGLGPCWQGLVDAGGSAADFVQALKRLDLAVVLDWGFPPRRWPVVESLKAAGVQVWWFDGDRNAARDSFAQRGTVPVELLDAQMQSIELHWAEISRVIGDHVIPTVSAGPKYVSPEIIFASTFSR